MLQMNTNAAQRPRRCGWLLGARGWWTRWSLACAVLLGVEICAAGESQMVTGADISMLPRHEELGSVYRCADGATTDALKLMRIRGLSLFRIRVFVSPNRSDDGVIQDTEYAVRLARRVKAAGGHVLLDLHYSDTWADPSHQTIPRAWSGLSRAALIRQVEDYTTATLKAFVDGGCAPEYVQLGNEITHGMLWPVGKTEAPGGWAGFAELLGAGARGVRRTLPSARIMLHADCGGKADLAVWFFGQLRAHQVPYDVIGLSYYPEWQGGIANLRTTLERCAREFDKDVMVVETAAAWRRHDKTRIEDWAQSPEGQRAFARDVLKAVRETPKGRGRGVLWWYPESVLVRGLHVWEGGAMALFDDSGQELPALKALGGQ